MPSALASTFLNFDGLGEILELVFVLAVISGVVALGFGVGALRASGDDRRRLVRRMIPFLILPGLLFAMFVALVIRG